MEDEININIGKYVETLVRQWRLLALFCLAFGVMAFIYVYITGQRSPVYEAAVLVASTKTQSEVSFGSPIKTTSEDSLDLTSTQNFYDRKARLESYVALVNSGNVAEQVLTEVGAHLSEGERTPTVLLGMVEAALLEKTDTIEIKVQYKKPEVAAEIANVWGKVYVNHINSLYGASSGMSYQIIEYQTVQTKVNYDNAQKILVDFILQDRGNEYKRQVEEITAIITNLRASRSTALTAIVNQKTATDQKLLEQMDNGLNQPVIDLVEQLNKAYTDNRQVKLFIENATMMREAIKQGGEASAKSNSLALTLLKTQMYASFNGSANIQIQSLPESYGENFVVNASDMITDLDAVIDTLRKSQVKSEALIAQLSSKVQNENDLAIDANSLLANQSVKRSQDLLAMKSVDMAMDIYTKDAAIENKIQGYEKQIRDLNAMISTSESKLSDLANVRDLAWQSYTALLSKKAEMEVATYSSGTVVSLASSASSGTAPTQPLLKKFLFLLAAGAGLLLGLVIAYSYEFWQSYTGRPIQTILPLRFVVRWIRNLGKRKPSKEVGSTI